MIMTLVMSVDREFLRRRDRVPKTVPVRSLLHTFKSTFFEKTTRILAVRFVFTGPIFDNSKTSTGNTTDALRLS